MFVACNTLCFSKEPLAKALRHIADLEFRKIDLALVEGGDGLHPSELAENLDAALGRLRKGPSISPSAFGADYGEFASSAQGSIGGPTVAPMAPMQIVVQGLPAVDPPSVLHWLVLLLPSV